jgi:diguanylate cyclase (GGDEF)-like protein/PAS domain S-box-containing protein
MEAISVPDNVAQGHYTQARSRIVTLVYFVLVSAIIISLTLSYRNEASASRSIARQAALSRIGQLTQDIRSVAWLNIAGREVTSESEVKVRDAKRQLADNIALLRAHTYGDKSVDQLNQTLSYYLESVDSQWQLIRSGHSEEARRVDFEQISPETDLLQQEIHDAIAPESKSAANATTRWQLEAVTASFLALTAIVIAALRFRRRQQFMIVQQASLQRSEDRFRTLTEKSADIVLITDSAGVIKYVSPSAKATLADDRSTLLGKSLADAVHPEDGRQLEQLLTVAKNQNLVLDFRLQHSDGRWLDFECVIRNLLEHENINGLVLNAREITDRKKVQEQLIFSASHDQLTGLPNRVLFLDRLQVVIDRIHRHRQTTAGVLFVDVDEFKVVNDCLGHAAGDEFIVEVGNRLRGCMRSDGTVARIGGDEFTVLLEDIAEPSDAIRVAQRIQAAVASPFLLLGQEVCKSVSIGIALASSDDSAESVVQNADLAMYRAKAKGKARSELFDSTMHEQVMGQLQLEVRLRRGLQNQEFRLYYQPIVEVVTGLVEGFEALLRWKPTDSDLIPPGVFIPVAEQSGLIVPISDWVLTEACREALNWHHQYPDGPLLYVSINVSAKHFSHPGFIGHVRKALETTGIPPQCVKIELTESVAMNDAPSTEETMSQLRALGVKLSIDDFGTGYSSLSYLRRFPVDTLKIDQSFIAAMETERDNCAIVSTVVALGHNLGLQVVAEGVETLSQFQKLRTISCHAAQGYFFSKPVPSDSVGGVVDAIRGRAKCTTKNPNVFPSHLPEITPRAVVSELLDPVASFELLISCEVPSANQVGSGRSEVIGTNPPAICRGVFPEGEGTSASFHRL